MAFGSSKDEQQSIKKPWSELFFKPKTRDERVKEHVPEVLEESLAEQRAVLAHQTTRDRIVEHGHKVLRELENKAPTPSIFPALENILQLYGTEHLVSQRALNLLCYPGTAACYQQSQPPELIASFHDNFKAFVDSIENDGSYHHDVKLPALEQLEEERKQLAASSASAAAAGATDGGDAAQTGSEDAKPAAGDASTDAAGAEQEAPAAAVELELEKPSAEPPDITYLVKCLSAMGLANVQIGDNKSALKCCDTALEHAIDDGRRGGILALKAGVQIKLKDYEGAHASALAAIEASQSPQGYLQGAAALRLMKRNEDAVKLLTEGVEANPGNDDLAGYLEATVTAEEKRAARIAAAEAAGEQLVEDGRRTRRRRLQLSEQ